MSDQYDHGPVLARKSVDEVTGRVHLEVIADDDQVLLKEGDEFVTFMTTVPLTAS